MQSWAVKKSAEMDFLILGYNNVKPIVSLSELSLCYLVSKIMMFKLYLPPIQANTSV